MDNIISQFMDITDVDRERAEFYLASSAWQLEVALANFYEYSESGPAADSNIDEQPVDQQAQEITKSEQVSESVPVNDSKIKSKIKGAARIGTLTSLQRRESSSDEEGQAFYAGGSEHSGQQVLGPSKKKNDIVGDMFKTCQEQSISIDEKSSSQQQRPSTFTGTGYKLGQTNSDTQVIEATASASAPTNTQMLNSSIITLKLWRDGFTINDQEIRSYNDPQNREFMEAIKRAEIPMELRQEVQGAEVRLDMEDHRHEEYVPQKHKVKVFTGRGHKLGSPSPATVGMTMPTDSADEAANESRARSQLNLNTSEPMTMIQIRLANGQNIREQFNLTHTVGDIRRFIATMRPQYATQEFTLLTSYPTTELSEENKTISEAGLKNCAIIQRFK